jgi:RNA-directed DNA polymerase
VNRSWQALTNARRSDVCVGIPTATGAARPLGIPIELDRLIQQAIAQVLVPIFDPGFSDYSYGFRPGRSAQDAVRRVRDHIREGYRTAVDLDLSKFSTELIMTCLWRESRHGYPINECLNSSGRFSSQG